MLEGKKVEIKTGGGFAPLPADKYTVQIVDVNLKTQLKYQSTEEEEVLNYQFEVLDDNPMPTVEGEEEATTRGRFLWKRCRLALNSKSHLGKLAAAVKGRVLTKEEADNFDPESIIDKQVDVMVEQSPSRKDPEIIFNNIISFSKTVKELEPFILLNKTSEVVEKKSSAVPTTAPDAEADEFIKGLEEDAKLTPEELEIKELKAQIAEAKAKMAKAKK